MTVGMDPETQAPTVLYKYLPPERIDLLENMQIRFGAPSEFNDTFDADYLVPRNQGPRAMVDRLRLRNRLGILCLTERPDDHLMWVHYARNHTGFVVGFNPHEDFFRTDGRALRKVVYEDGPRVFPSADLDVCFYKSDEWKYEQEWRCARQFEPSESRLVEISPSLITEIIFGSKMASWQIARITLLATAYEMTGRTKFAMSTPSRKTWTLENKPKKISVCNHCDGNGYLMEDSTSEF